ncbi:MAG: hypothetical protein FWF52_04830 [Candidatus Azobacteroides sp.]|nr:hypothetical protein [Candidatus Azobacteroides sp.]
MKRIFLILNILLVTFIGCNSNENNEETCNCNNEKHTFQQTNLQGIINFNNEIQKWYISVHTDGSIDNVKLFFPCNMNEEYKKRGENVVFSGKAFDFNRNITTPAGYECFCIELTTINN